MRIRSFVLSALFLLLALLPFLGKADSYEGAMANAQIPQLDYASFINSINMTGVQEHIQFFSSLETRGAGYPGNRLACEYIYDKFINAHLENVSLQPFNVVSCIDHGANVTLSSDRVVKVYPLLPNLVSPSTTPPNGITGRLIYVGDGYLSDFDGLEVEGSIVLMNWYGRENWINAADLGAKAVIFIPPTSIYPSYFMEGWNLPDIPFLFPRFYIPNATVLLNHLNKSVTLKAYTTWETVTSWNVIGFVRGKDPRAICVLTAHYDSGGIVPSFAPGAREACGISDLIELAKYFSVNQPQCTIMFVALSGHWDGFSGMVKFTDDYLSRFNSTYAKIGEKIWFLFNLDLSTGTDAVSFNAYSGSFPMTFQAMNYMPYIETIPRYFKDVLTDMNVKKPLGKTYDDNIVIDYIVWWRDVSKIAPYFIFIYESEVAMRVSYEFQTHFNDIVAYTFATSNDPRPYYGYPFNTFDKMREGDFNRLQKQLELVHILICSFLFHDNLYNTFVVDARMGKIPMAPEGFTSIWGHVVPGNVVEWNNSRGWYDPIPHALVRFSHGGFPFYLYAFTDKNGSFSFSGPIGSWWPYTLTAYKLNSTTGEIIYAPDGGIHAYSLGTGPVGLEKVTKAGYLVLFKAATIVLPNPGDPSVMYSAPEQVSFSLYDSKTYVIPESWKFIDFRRGTQASSARLIQGGESANMRASVAVIAVPPDTSVIVIAKRALERYPWFILSNSSERETYGYMLKPQQQLVITQGMLRYAEDHHRINKEVFSRLLGISVHEQRAEEFRILEQVDELLNKAHAALDNLEYSKCYTYASQAWSLSHTVYSYARSKIEDTTYTIPLIALLLVPFIFLSEKLVFSSSGMKRVAAIIAIFAAVLVILGILHPGFVSSFNPAMIIIGISTLILVVPLLAIMLGRVSSLIEAIRVRILGPHAAVMSRGSEVVISFSLGVSNMRKRRLRTALILTSIVISMAALISFASMSSVSMPIVRSVETGQALYNGIYIHKERWGSGDFDVGHTLLDYIKNAYGDQAVVCPRAWKYSNYATEMRYKVGFRVTLGERTILVRALLGLTPEEENLSRIDTYLTNGRWFLPSDYMVVVLTEGQAQELEANVTDTIFTSIGNLTVVGIISDYYFYIREIDGEEITPIKMNVEGNPFNIHTAPSDMLILKFDDLVNMGAYIPSISVKFEDVSSVAPVAKELKEKLYRLPLWACAGQKTLMYALGSTVIFGGLQFQAMPLIIVGLIIFSALLGSVNERIREIHTYSTVGLSPLQISFLFLAETTVYAFLGAMIGYLAGLAMSQIFFILPGAVPVNYGSKWVLMTIAISMGCVFFSSIYPVIISARIVTPSLKRKWEITSTPVGDLWEIPFPFRINRDEEAEALIAFINEYVDAHVGEALATDFSCRNVSFELGEMQGAPVMQIRMETKLPPYDLGITQEVSISLIKQEKVWNTYIVMKRIGGSTTDWTRYNRSFIDLIRKQFLLWGSIPITDKVKYAEKFKELKKT